MIFVTTYIAYLENVCAGTFNVDRSHYTIQTQLYLLLLILSEKKFRNQKANKVTMSDVSFPKFKFPLESSNFVTGKKNFFESFTLK